MKHKNDRACSRRSFLRGTGLALSGFGLASLFPRALIDSVMAGTLTGNRRLIFIFLRGGNDGINTVIPHGDPGYNATIRPTLYIDPASAIDLNGFASLHPALSDMSDAYDAGELAVLHRIGYQNNSRSHFDGQRIWENGDPAETQLFEGWLHRYIREHAVSAGVNLPVLTVQSATPLLLRGDERYVNIANPDFFDYPTTEPLRSKLAVGWRGAHEGLGGLEPYRPLLSQTGVKLVDTLDEYAAWDQANWDPKDPDDPTRSLFPVNGASNQIGFSGESYSFFQGLKTSALALLESDEINNNGTRIAGTQLGGWDTHNGQGQVNGRHAELLSWLGYGMRSLRIVLSGAAIEPRGYASIWNDTAVVTLSEFGRTSLENGSQGCDHGAASCLFLQGGTVNGGVYNCSSGTWPGGVMFGVNGRYLLERTDYRAVFWEILRDHMGASPTHLDTVFPGYTSLGLGSQELGLIQA